MKKQKIGRLFGLDVSYVPSALFGYTGLFVVLSLLAGLVFDVQWGMALLLGLAGAAMHGISDAIHHLGHAFFARRTGYPMTGFCFWFIFATSEYPANEPRLPASIHIRRALGGPAASGAVSLLFGLITLLVPAGGPLWLLAWFVFLDNLLIFTLQVLIPMGFNDGGTLFYWMRHRAS